MLYRGKALAGPIVGVVKIPPQSIGVGMYQHDVSEKKLTDQLELVVSNVVSDAGVHVNSASLMCFAMFQTQQFTAKNPLTVRSSGLETPKTSENHRIGSVR